MALTRVKTWGVEVLTAADLNAEFNNILDNALSLVSPWTANMAAGGFRLTGLALGAVADPALQFTGDTNTGIWSAGADRLNFSTAGGTRMEVMAGGAVYIGGAATPVATFMTNGLIIDQGAASNEGLILKGDSVAHGMTSITDTNTFGRLMIDAVTTGGYRITGFSEATVAVHMQAAQTTTDTAARTTASTGAFMFDAYLRSGTTTTSLGANANMVAFADNGTARFVLDSDGDSHQDVGTAWTNFDEYDDVALLNALAVSLARTGDPLRQAFVGHLADHRAALEAMPGKPLISFGEGGHPFANMSRLTMLLTGATRQLGGRQSRHEVQVGQRFERIERALHAAGLVLGA